MPKKLTQKRVKELFNYKKDGKLIRRRHKSSNACVGDIAGSIGTSGHLYVQIDGIKYLVHRVAWLWHYGYMPENGLDHIDKNKLNNRVENLREVSQSCNSRNTKNPKDNVSGVKGISWCRKNKKWRAVVKVPGKHCHIGYFLDFDEAVYHRLAAEQCLDWQGCDSSSPAYKYVKGINNGK